MSSVDAPDTAPDSNTDAVGQAANPDLAEGQVGDIGDVGHVDAGHDHDDHHPSDAKYIQIAVILAVITGAEVAASYLDLGPVFIPLLLAMMVAKFLTVVGFFMHLRFDNRIFTWLFYTGITLALFVYIVALLTFRFFDS